MTELSVRHRAQALIRNGRWGKWINRGTWTLLDRGLFALSNFGLNIVLARWMSPEAYGAFAIAFSVFLIIGSAQSTMITGPLLVFGPRRFKDRYPAYLGLVIKGQFCLSLVISLGLALVGGGFLLAGKDSTGTVFLALAVSGPFILPLWLLRSSGYARLQARGAAISGTIYLVLLLLLAYGFFQLGILTPSTALFLMAGTSLVVAIRLAVRLGADLRAEKLRGPFAREVMLEHWRYARWMLPAHLLIAARNNLFYFILPVWAGLEATGALRAYSNLIMPIGFMGHSLSTILVPILVRARANGSLAEKTVLGFLLFLGNAIAYAAVLILFQDAIVEAVYPNKYDAYAHLVWLIAILPVVQSPSIVLGAALQALEKPKNVFWATLAGVGSAVTVGLALVALWGALGAAIGNLVSASVITGLLMFLLWAAWRGKRTPAGPPAAGRAAQTAREPEEQ
jgi:O-antigen/teichoic acid export membrane protein